jgi:hypothetical protein
LEQYVIRALATCPVGEGSQAGLSARRLTGLVLLPAP